MKALYQVDLTLQDLAISLTTALLQKANKLPEDATEKAKLIQERTERLLQGKGYEKIID